jgi:hypothetical protein
VAEMMAIMKFVYFYEGAGVVDNACMYRGTGLSLGRNLVLYIRYCDSQVPWPATIANSMHCLACLDSVNSRVQSQGTHQLVPKPHP